MKLLKQMFCLAVVFLFAAFALSAFAQESETVEATGYADSEKQAELAALDRAVRMVIGELVDAETRVEKEELIEKILIAARGSVESHEVLSSENEDGVWTVKIRATVKKTDLNARLKTKGIATKNFSGATIGANIDLVKGQDNQNIMFLANFLKSNEFPYSLIDVEIEEEPKVVKQEGDDVIIEVGYLAQVNMERYDAFVKELVAILDKVAIRKGTFTLNMTREKESEEPNNNLLNICQGVLYFPDENRKLIPAPEEGNITVSVCVSSTGKYKMTRWLSYELSNKYGILLSKYMSVLPVLECAVNDTDQNIMIAKRQLLGIKARDNLMNYNLFPKSSDFYTSKSYYEKQEDTDKSFILYTDKIGYSGANEKSWHTWKKRVLIGPFGNYMYQNRSWFPYFRNTIQFTLSSDDLRKVKTASIALVPENPDMDKFYGELEKKLQRADE